MDITIVIPTYNRKTLIKRTLNSIMRSSMSQQPIIVVDNGSTDDTMEFLHDYTLSHPHVTVLSEPQRGAAATRNCGLAAVRTEWVYFFDSDDEFEAIPSHWDSSAQLIAFPTRQRVEGKVSVRAYKPVADPALQILNSMLNTVSMIFKTAWLREIGGWNTTCRIWDDWELGARALMMEPIVQWITDRAYHTINVHPESLTGPNFKSRYEMQLEATNEVLKCITMTHLHTQKRCLKALLLRTYILSGKLLYEGDKRACAACRTFISEHFGPHPQGSKFGRLLEQYTAMGGRGAWRIAIWSLPSRY